MPEAGWSFAADHSESEFQADRHMTNENLSTGDDGGHVSEDIRRTTLRDFVSNPV